MRYFTCCCGWSYVIGKKHVYGAIWPIGIGTYPDALSKSQRMMTRADWKDQYDDCWACATGRHVHAAARPCGGVQHREIKSAGQTIGGACGGTRLGNPCDEDGLTR